MQSNSFFDYIKYEDDTREVKLLSVEIINGQKTRSRIIPSKLNQILDLKDDVKGKNLIITGPGPIEVYFALGYYLTLFGVKSINYKQHDNFLIQLGKNNGVENKSWLNICCAENNGNYVQIKKSTSLDGKWSSEEIGYDICADLSSIESIATFTGSGAVAMYALLGISAARQNLLDARIEKPQEPYVIGFSPELAGVLLPNSNNKDGIVVGVIGDPNSGKSVLSHSLFHALRIGVPEPFTSWIYDCDLASPTPNWYCEALSTANSKEAEDYYKALRESYKAKWGTEMEQRCAKDLSVLRKNLDLVLADLPGGRHPKPEDTFLPQRIPSATRVEMFKECNYFILICRKDKKEIIYKGWYDALAEHGLQDRILCVIESSLPEAQFDVTNLHQDSNGTFICKMQGLDRKQGFGTIGNKIVEKVGEILKYFSLASL